MIKTYYHLTKPGIIYGNTLSAVAAFLLASKGYYNLPLFLAMLIGLALVIGSACVFNNIWDRDIDDRMERTKSRAMVTGQISKRNAFLFATVLGIIGMLTLNYYVNHSALLAAAVGFFVYTLVYTPLKRRTVHATLIGAIAGATPPVVGYTAVTNHFDLAALLLFAILVVWQMPHFYSIAIRRLDDYKAADVPVLPAKKGTHFTKIWILIYIVLFIVATILLRVFKYTNDFYLGVMIVLGVYWLWMGIQGFKADDEKAWAKRMFLLSLIILLAFSFTIALSGIIKA